LAIARYTGGDSERIITSRTRNWMFGFHGNRVGRWYAQGWIDYGTNSDTQWHMMVGAHEKIGGDPKAWLWRDGSLISDGVTGSNNTWFGPGQLQLGAWNTNLGETSKAEVAELLLFNRELPYEDREKAEGYLAHKWGFSLPDGHLWKDTSPYSNEIIEASVTIEGGEAPLIKIYWGDEDAGQTTDVDQNNSAAWDNVITANTGQPLDLGIHAIDVTGLARDVAYYFRAYAENTAGGAWSTATKSFVASDSRLTKDTLSGLIFWLDAGDLDGNDQPDSLVDGTPVAQWIDKSNGAGFAFQTTEGAKPSYSSVGFEGLPGVNFNWGQYLNVGTLDNQPGASVFAVVKGAGKVIAGFESANPWSLDASPDKKIESLLSNLVTPTQINVGREPMNGTEFFVGLIGEILIFDHVLTEDEKYRIEGYLAHKWGVTEDLEGNFLILRDDLDLLLDFEETSGSTAADSSGYSRHAILSNATSMDLDVDGKFGSGLSFTANNDRLILGANMIDLGTEWTISSWFIAPVPDTGAKYHVLSSGQSLDQQIMLRNNTANNLGVWASGQGNFRAASPSYSPNSLVSGWHQIVAVGSGGVTKFYVDGQSAGESNRQSESDVYAIGNHASNSQPIRFADRIDDFRIYSKAFVQADVDVLYGGGNGDFGMHPYFSAPPIFDNRPVIVSPSRPVLSWSFEDTYGTTIGDFAGGDSNGTILGSPEWVPGRDEIALKLDGGDHLTADGDALGLTTGFSFSGWIHTSDDKAIIARNGQFSLQIENGYLQGFVQVEGSWVGTGQIPVLNNVWTHLSLVWNGQTITLHTNGSATSPVAASGNLTWGDGADHKLYVGKRANTSDWDYDGLIDDLRIHDRALTPQEVQDLLLLKPDPLVARYGNDYQYQVQTGKGPDHYTATGLPAGLDINATTGIISGQPTAIGTFPVLVSVSNSSGEANATIALDVVKAEQAINFPQSLASVHYGDIPMELNATTSSGLPVTYSLTAGNDKADLNGSTLSFLATGAATVEIIQSGNGNYLPAAPIVINFQVGKAELVVTAHNQFRKIGLDNPALSYDLTGFVNGENTSALIEQPICNTPAIITSLAGEYPITPSGGLAVSYFFSYLQGTLTVSDKKEQHIVFGQN
ncbi:MAG: LamG-like jellyroll fold domain-containing protein, partial [Opitutales bacterium]